MVPEGRQIMDAGSGGYYTGSREETPIDVGTPARILGEVGLLLIIASCFVTLSYRFIKGSLDNFQTERAEYLTYLKEQVQEQQKSNENLWDEIKKRDQEYLNVLGNLKDAIKRLGGW